LCPRVLDFLPETLKVFATPKLITTMRNSEELPIYLKIYQFIKFLYGMIENFPKQYKYTLGEDILRIAWECLDAAIDANSLPNDKKYFKILALSANFDKLKTRMRMAQEIKIMSCGQFSHINTCYTKEIGEMVGGWLNWAKSQKI
jgi:hypothetical protein